HLLEKRYSDNSYNEFFDYDVNGNLTVSNKGRVSLSYEYDSNNRLIEEALLLNDLKIMNNQKDKSLVLIAKYEYNSKGDLAAITYPDNTRIELDPNEYGQPTRLGNYIDNISYHSNGH